MNKFLLLLLLPMLSSPLLSQEVETYLMSNPYQAAENEARLPQSALQKSTQVVVVELPFIDDFSQDHFPGNADGNTVLWEDLQAYRNLGFGIDPPSVGVVTFDGLDALGRAYKETTGENNGYCDTLTSMPMDLDGLENVVLSFFYQPQGLGEKPEQGDSLILQFYVPSADTWLNRWGVSGTPSMPFDQVLLNVGDIYLQDGFRFRFISFGSQEGSLDVWNVDWVFLDENRTTGDDVLIDVGVKRPEYTLLEGDIFAMPWSHFTPSPGDYMVQTRNYFLQNNWDQGAFIASSGYEVSYDGAVLSSFTDSQSPSIAGMSCEPIPQEVDTSPNNFVYDTTVDDDSATFEVSFSFSTSPDINADNNEYAFEQVFTDYYAYDDGQAERGYGFTQSTSLGQLAIRFDVMEADSLSSIDMYLLPGTDNAENALVYLTVWQDEGGEPGEIIYEDLTSRELYYSGTNGFVRYCLDSLVYLEEGPVHLGLRQVNTVGDLIHLNIGIDKNHNSNADRMHLQTEDSDGWQGTTIVGSLLLRAGFSSACELNIDITGLTETEEIQAQLWPNPAQDHVDIRLDENGSYSLRLLDGLGRVIRSEQLIGTQHRMDLRELSDGLYYLHIMTADGDGQGVKKIVIGG